MSKTLQVASSARSLASSLGAPRCAPGGLSAAQLRPMLCSIGSKSRRGTSSARLDDPGMLYELKLDGVRIVAVRRGEKVKLVYRSSRGAERVYPEVAEALLALPEDDFAIDGEIVALDAEGRPDFELLGRRIAAETGDVARARREVPVAYLVFDALSVGGLDARGLPVEARKELVRALLPERSIVTPHDGHVGLGRELWRLCEERGLEGVVGKRLGSPYRPGDRGADWVKWKLSREDDFVVVGATRGEGSRRELGALDLATYAADGRLVVRGKVGSGLTEHMVALLAPRLAALRAPAPRAEGFEREERVYLEPRLVVKVRYFGWSGDGHLRGPVFLGLRDDVEPASCVAAPTGA